MDENHTIELSAGELEMIEIALRVWREDRRRCRVTTSLVLGELILKMSHKNSAIASGTPFMGMTA
tara:strand:- start:508 stop:702 length:195 start_codon:yes stop_codon:yes gene_type:complete